MKKFEIISIIALFILLYMRLSTLSTGQENSHDAYYHVMIADFGYDFYTAKELPSMTMSYWSTHFSDKELMFHLILSGIRSTMRVCSFNIDPPFHLEYLIFISLFLFSFWLLAYKFKITYIYLYMIALISISPFFITRLLLLRPHILSFSLMMFSCILFSLNPKTRKKNKLSANENNCIKTNNDKKDNTRYDIEPWKYLSIVFIIGFIMAWSYSNPHFILLPAVAFSIPLLRNNWKLGISIPIITLLGIIIGFTIHPQFPNTFINWKIQCIDVMLVSLDSLNPVALGSELRPANWTFIKNQSLLFIIFMVNSILFIKYIYSTDFMKYNRNIVALSIMMFITTLGTFFAIRGVEYAVPFNLLTLALLVKEPTSWFNLSQYFNHKFNISKPTSGFHIKNIIILIITLFTISVLIFNYTTYYKKAKNRGKEPFYDFALWLDNNKIPKGTTIANINWSDFPLLFHAAPEYRYLFGIDPMFAYYKFPKKVTKIELFRTGKGMIKPKNLLDIVKSRFVFVSKYNRQLSSDMYKNGYVAIYQGKDGDLFDLYRSSTKK